MTGGFEIVTEGSDKDVVYLVVGKADGHVFCRTRYESTAKRALAALEDSEKRRREDV